MDKLFRVTNNTNRDVYRTWNTALFTPQMRASYERYKQTTLYTGASREEQRTREKMPEIYKIREWIQLNRHGSIEQVYDEEMGEHISRTSKNPVTGTREIEYKFKLGKNETIIMTEAAVEALGGLVKKVVKISSDPTAPPRKDGFLEIEPLTGAEMQEFYANDGIANHSATIPGDSTPATAEEPSEEPATEKEEEVKLYTREELIKMGRGKMWTGIFTPWGMNEYYNFNKMKKDEMVDIILEKQKGLGAVREVQEDNQG